jgi:hypothetical protein
MRQLLGFLLALFLIAFSLFEKEPMKSSIIALLSIICGISAFSQQSTFKS